MEMETEMDDGLDRLVGDRQCDDDDDVVNLTEAERDRDLTRTRTTLTCTSLDACPVVYRVGWPIIGFRLLRDAACFIIDRSME